MRSTFTKQRSILAAACALSLGAFCAAAAAQETGEHILVKDSSGQQVMSGAGVCLHSGFGPQPSWTAACHAALPARVTQYAEKMQYVAKAIPAPAAAAAAPLAIYEKVVFDANVLFDSNKSDLRRAGRDTLDAFVGKIRGLESQSVMAIGYADRMGGTDSNQILSEERVDSVKAYLVASGVAAERIKTSGWGETRPTTRAAECKDANNPRNVACMQPDRHVFIEISGSRLAQ
jgi:OOP family OmpA-OmpF porin